MEPTSSQQIQTSSFLYIQPNFEKKPNLLSSSRQEEFKVFLIFFILLEFERK
jgi:hypothetical protein